MFISELTGNPNDCHSVKPGSIGEDLPQVGVIRSFELILNQHPVLCVGVLTENVRPERPDVFLLGFELQFYADCVAKEL